MSTVKKLSEEIARGLTELLPDLNKPVIRKLSFLFSMDQTELGGRMAILMLTVRIGGRALLLIWTAEEGSANIGFAKQKALLEQVLVWVPEGAKAMLPADRFYPSAVLFRWLDGHDWQHRLRLKGNLLADPGFGEKTTTGGVLPPGMLDRYLFFWNYLRFSS